MSLRGYRRSYIGPDLVAALTLLVIALPEQLATSRLAGMPPLTGLYAFIAGSVAFALLGSNPRMSVGADSTIAPLFAVGVAGLAAPGAARYVELVSILAVLVGVIVALVGLLRLGWIALLLSTPIITGFLGGVAVIVVVHQLPDLLGLPSPGGSMLHRIGYVAARLDRTNAWTLTIGLIVLVSIVASERLDRRIPGALIGLIASVVMVVGFGLRSHGVVVIGSLPGGGPHLGLRGLSFAAIGRLLPLAGVVALVVVSQSAATTRAFAAGDPEPGSVGRDFIGVGAGSILAGMVGSYPVDASPPRTAAVVAAGGRTQVTSLVAAAAMAALIPAAGLLRDVPVATLAAVLLFVASRIVHSSDVVSIARFSRFELALAAIGMFTVALVGVEQGIIVAVGLAILDRARLDARPVLHVLGRLPGTTSYAPLSAAREAEQIPGVLVVLFATPLWYANALHFTSEMEAALRRAEGPLRVVVLDSLGMSDIDFTGARALSEVLDMLARRGVTLVVARAGSRVRDSLDRAGITERIGAGHFYATVGEAVSALASPT